MDKNNVLISKNKKRIVFTISSFLLVYLVGYIIDPFARCWNGYFTRNPLEILGEWAISLLSCFIISEISIVVHDKLDRVLTWKESASKRLFAETAINLVAALSLNLLTNYFLYLCDTVSDSANVAISLEETRGAIQWITVSVLIALMIMGLNIGIHLITNWKNESIRAAELNQVVLEAELQALKVQIDPHFVFNNLSALSELILEDQKLGYAYAENFSKIYRYLLLNSKKDIISLEEELRFLDAYIFLIKNRFVEGVQFEIEVDPELYSLQLPPLTLQLLVENALKHNQTSKKRPLLVRVYTNPKKELIVENVLIPIETRSESSGMGMANIIKRYKLLSDQQPQIINDGNLFKVILPLL